MSAIASLNVRTLLRTLRERKAQTEGDRLLAERLHALLEGEAPPPGTEAAHGLQVYVFEGMVTAYGRVNSFRTRDDVMTALGGVPGVRGITDCLQIAD